MLAEAARLADIPFIQSGARTASIEAVARVAPQHAWYQLYQPRDPKLADALIGRARDAGVGTFVLTVDSQTSANQERNIRNGLKQPLTITPSMVLQALARPMAASDAARISSPRYVWVRVSASWGVRRSMVWRPADSRVHSARSPY